jgi:hypothetical protein
VKIFIKNSLFFLASFSLVQTQFVSASESKIHSVQVFPTQAEVVRIVQVNLHSGTQTIELANLPANIRQDSLRITGDSKDFREKIRILSIELETVYQDKWTESEAESAEKILQKAESNLRKLTDAYSTLKEEESFLNNLQLGKLQDEKSSQPRRDWDPEAWIGSLSFIQTSLEANHKSMEKLLDKIDLAREELNYALFLSEKFKSRRSEEKNTIRILVRSQEKIKTNFYLSYRIPGAIWYPIYTAKISSEGNQAEVNFLSSALLQNQTGEDWMGVPIEFSSSDPDQKFSLPVFREWRITVQSEETTRPLPVQPKQNLSRAEANQEAYTVPIKSKKMSPPPAGKAVMDLDIQSKKSNEYYKNNLNIVSESRASQRSMESQETLSQFRKNIQDRSRALDRKDYQAALEVNQKVIENLQGINPGFKKYFREEERETEKIRRIALQMQENVHLMSMVQLPKGGGFESRIPSLGRESVPSDGSLRRVLLSENKYKMDIFYESIPQKSDQVFRSGVLELRNNEQILPGPISVFFDQDYLGESMIVPDRKSKGIPLNLGSTDDIQILYKTRKSRESSGLIGKSFIQTFESTVQIKNRKKKPIRLWVLSRIPITESDQVKIRDIKFSKPPGPDSKPEFGLYRNSFLISPQENADLNWEYKIQYSQDYELEMSELENPKW